MKLKGRQLALEIMRISNKPLSPEEMLDEARKRGFYKYYTPWTDDKQKLVSFGVIIENSVKIGKRLAAIMA